MSTCAPAVTSVLATMKSLVSITSMAGVAHFAIGTRAMARSQPPRRRAVSIDASTMAASTGCNVHPRTLELSCRLQMTLAGTYPMCLCCTRWPVFVNAFLETLHLLAQLYGSFRSTALSSMAMATLAHSTHDPDTLTYSQHKTSVSCLITLAFSVQLQSCCCVNLLSARLVMIFCRIATLRLRASAGCFRCFVEAV